MGKKLACKDVGLECDAVIQGETEDEVMQKAAAHAAKDHGMTDIPEDQQKKIRSLIQEA